MRSTILRIALAVVCTALPARAHAQLITFSGATASIAGPTPFSFTFGTPIVERTFSFATYTYSLSLTGGQEQASVVPGTSFIEGGVENDGIATALGFGSTFAPCVAGAGVTVVCASGIESLSFGPQLVDWMVARLSYVQAGTGSQVAFEGRLELFENAPTVVPEPATFVLLAGGLGALAVALRGRRRRG